MNHDHALQTYDGLMHKASGYTFLDTRELVRRHMQDPNHVLTNEEMQAVQISTAHIDVASHPLVKGM